MTDSSRLDPDLILKQIQDDEKKSKRGRLKIFFGSSAGVGKTYAMLKAAHEQLEQGKIVLVGLVETHGRPETDALLEGLMLLQPHEVNYRGMQLKEFDLDAALTRNPDIILVDELAHTNAPGSRHPKRWNDIVELLDAGIDVFTTLNVQHIESLSDLVAGTTGVWVKETIPDTIFDSADDVVLVDLDEDDLIQRLHEGKVYVAPGAMARASENFFKKQNLSALRELALRRTADRVDAERKADIVGLGDRLPLAEKILVCLGTDAMSAKLVRAAKRLATGLKAPWVAVTVEGAHTSHTHPETRRLMNALERMIERMGGKFITLHSESIAGSIISYAKENRITKIVIGRTPDKGWMRFFKKPLLDDIIRRSGLIDVYVITSDAEKDADEPVRSITWLRPFDFLLSLVVFACLSIPGFMLPDVITATDQALIYLTGIVMVAIRLGLAPSLFYALLAASSLQRFFVDRYADLLSANRPVLITYIMTLLTGYVVATQASRLHAQAVHAREQERLSRDLFQITRKLASTRGRFPVSEIMAAHISDKMDCDVTIWMTNEEGHPSVVLGNLPDETYYKDFGALQWCFENGQPSGRGSETMPSAAGCYFPLVSASGTLGVIGVYPRDSARGLTGEEIANVDVLSGLLAGALERVRAGEILRQAMVEKESEKLRESFIKATASQFRVQDSHAQGYEQDRGATQIDPAALQVITKGLTTEAFKLSKSVRRFMNSTNGEMTPVQMSRRPTSLADRVRRSLERLKDTLASYRIENNVPDTLPDIMVDLNMCEQAIVSFLVFVAQTSPTGGRIGLSAVRKNASIILNIMQERSTLPNGIEQRFVDQLVPAMDDTPLPELPGDIGVAAGIVRLHGGQIETENSHDGSAKIVISLPIA